MQQCLCSMQGSKMRFLWLLASGINYMLLLLFSIFLAVTGTTISSNTTVSPVAINGSTAQTTSTTLTPANASSTKSPIGGVTAQPGSTSIDTTPLSTNTAIPTREDATTGTRPEERPLKFWGIILISLVVTAAVVAGFVGCCFYCRKNNI